MDKRGQMKLSFGMIFSIFLIIIFISAAIYFIIKFLDLQESIQIETFENDLQNDIDQMWQSQQGSREVEYPLPKKIIAVCFLEDDSGNLLLQAETPLPRGNINKIDMEFITAEESVYCIATEKGKIILTLTKDYGETLVKITG